MNLLENPFHLLRALPTDDRKTLLERAEEMSLLGDADAPMDAVKQLINPKTRLKAEIAWLPGVDPDEYEEITEELVKSKDAANDSSNLPALARANLLATALLEGGPEDEDDRPHWLCEIASSLDDADPEDLLFEINSARSDAEIPLVASVSELEAALFEHRSLLCSSLRSYLNSLPLEDRVEVLTKAIELATDDGDAGGPPLLDELVDAYEVDIQPKLSEMQEAVEAKIEEVRRAAGRGASDIVLSTEISKLNVLVKTWDRYAQPIQVSAKSRGLTHEASKEIAIKVRSLAIDLVNEHGKVELAKHITATLEESFAEVRQVVELVTKDRQTLDNMMDVGELKSLLDRFMSSVGAERRLVALKLLPILQRAAEAEGDPEAKAKLLGIMVIVSTAAKEDLPPVSFNEMSRQRQQLATAQGSGCGCLTLVMGGLAMSVFSLFVAACT